MCWGKGEKGDCVCEWGVSLSRHFMLITPISLISVCMLVLGKGQGHTGQYELDLSHSHLW